MHNSTGNPRLCALGIGDALVDLSTYAAELPPLGGNIWSTAVTMSPGGTTNNVAAGLAQLGIDSAFVGALGDDPYGQYLVDRLQDVGVDTHGVYIKHDTYTGIVLTIINDTGERTFIACAKGAAHTKLAAADVMNIDFDQADTVHSTGVCLVEAPSRQSLLMALQIAHDRDKAVFFDPNLRLEGNVLPETLREAEQKAMQLSTVVMLSEEELSLLCEASSLQANVDWLLGAGVKAVVVKRGVQGAAVYTLGEQCSVPAFEVNVISTAGAGDAFDSGFIAARLRSASLHGSLLYASAVAAIKVTREHAQSAPSHNEVLAFMEERGLDVGLKA